MTYYPTDAMSTPPGGSVVAGGPIAFAAHCLRVIRVNLHHILQIAAIVFLVIMLAWLIWPAKYKAIALVAIDPQNPRTTVEQGVNPAASEAAVVSFAEVASADSFLIPLAKQENLLDDPEFDDGTDTGAIGVSSELRRNLKVTRRGLSYLIDITFSSKNAEKAARIANAVANEIVRRQQTLRREATSGVSDALKSRLADLRAAVLASEKAVADYRQENNLLDVTPDGRIGLKRLNSLLEQVGPLRSRLDDARARLEKLKQVKADDDIDPDIFRSDRLNQLQLRLTEEKRLSAAAALTYGPRHPSLEASQARIATITTAIRTERSRILDQAKADVDVLAAQIASYEAEIAKRQREQLGADQKEVALQALVLQAQSDRQIYEQFLARQKTTQEQSDISIPEAVVVSAAAPPSKTIRPTLPIALAAAAVAGLGTGVMWAFFAGPVIASRPRRDEKPDDEDRFVEIRDHDRRAEPPVAEAPVVLRDATPAPAVAAIPPPAPSAPPAPVAATAAPPPVVSQPIVPAPVVPAPIVATAPVAVEPATETRVPPPTVTATAPVVGRPASRRRLLRLLTAHDVPLVADLDRGRLRTGSEGLESFAATLCGHIDERATLTVSITGTSPAAVIGDLADAVADAVEHRGHSVSVVEGVADQADDEDDVIVEILGEANGPRRRDAHPFVLLAVDTADARIDRLGALLEAWDGDPGRVVAAAFVGDRA